MKRKVLIFNLLKQSVRHDKAVQKIANALDADPIEALTFDVINDVIAPAMGWSGEGETDTIGMEFLELLRVPEKKLDKAIYKFMDDYIFWREQKQKKSA